MKTEPGLRPDFRGVCFAPYDADADSLPLPHGEFWVFAYGSLMWKPGFAVRRAVAARLYGYHRRLCLWSIYYRGTRRRPGLVLGLDRGGSCNGMALCVAEKNARAAAEYLLRREMVHNSYSPVIKKVYLQSGKSVDALTFVSKREHPQFAGAMRMEHVLAVVTDAAGCGGTNRDYILNTARHLGECNIHHAELHAVAEKLR